MAYYCEDPDERARLRARRKFQMDLQHNQIVSYENGLRIGRLEGLLESLNEATLGDKRDDTLVAESEDKLDPKHQGRLEGKRQGIYEAKLEDAHNLFAMGISQELIVKITGLSPDKIQRLVN